MSRGITQEEFAEEIDVSPSYYQKLERGVRTCSLDILVCIAEHLHVSTDYLLTGKWRNTDEMKKAQDEEGESTIGVDTLNIFVNVAHCMARQADKTVPADIEEWLDQFSMFSIYQVLPEILELWNLNMTQISVSKKNIEALNGA